jgi:hypothetical protein
MDNEGGQEEDRSPLLQGSDGEAKKNKADKQRGRTLLQYNEKLW